MIEPHDLVVLDTNVLIHLMRRRAAGRYLSRRYRLDDMAVTPIVCVVTVGECFSFAEYNGWGPAKRDALRDRLSALIVVDIHHEPVIEAYAKLDVASRRMGRKMSKNDLWIAAVAMSQDAALLTTDGDFGHLSSTHVRVEHVPAESLPRDSPRRS